MNKERIMNSIGLFSIGFLVGFFVCNIKMVIGW